MPEYIDKEKLIRDLIDNRSFYPAIVKSAIENAPTEDVVEVVRCKYCIHKKEPIGNCPKDVIWCDKLYTLVHEKHYCSYGERKE